MQKWLSFIVPVYNVEDFLEECVDSMLNQNFPHEKYEIILFDDGSSDSSLEIAEKYARTYSNIRTYTHANAGAAQTRNEAIEVAEGTYIWFVDSDDFITPDLLSNFFEKTKDGHLDMLIFNNIAYEDGKCRRFTDFDVPISAVKKGINLYVDFYYNPVLTNRLIRRELLMKHNLRFLSGNRAEDCVLNPYCFYHANAVASVPIDAYYYRMRSLSVSHHIANQGKIIDSLVVGLESHCKYMVGHPAPQFWMRVFVHDIRRIHIWLDTTACETIDRCRFISREKMALRQTLKQIPFIPSVDYAILALASMSPLLILNIQHFLRFIKRKIKR